MRHIKAVAIRKLDLRTAATTLPSGQPTDVPYFARRKFSAAFRRLDEGKKNGRGTDSTIAISEDRED